MLYINKIFNVLKATLPPTCNPPIGKQKKIYLKNKHPLFLMGGRDILCTAALYSQVTNNLDRAL